MSGSEGPVPKRTGRGTALLLSKHVHVLVFVSNKMMPDDGKSRGANIHFKQIVHPGIVTGEFIDTFIGRDSIMTACTQNGQQPKRKTITRNIFLKSRTMTVRLLLLLDHLCSSVLIFSSFLSKFWKADGFRPSFSFVTSAPVIHYSHPSHSKRSLAQIIIMRNNNL